MKKILIGLLCLLAACKDRPAPVQQPVTADTAVAAPAAVPDNVQTAHLKALFRAWQQEEIASGRMWAKDSCYMGWFENHEYDTPISDLGFPDSADIHYSYADLNSDGKLDQLVSFQPAQCDGGNASMWTQISVLTVSERGSYSTNAELGTGIYDWVGKDTAGFYFYDSIGVNRIYGTYFSFSEEDGHCCPGTVMPVIFDYRSRKLVYKGPNTAKY